MLLYITNLLCLILCFLVFGTLALFNKCNHKIEVKAGEKIYVNSPYYPSEYPIGSSCRYVIQAPQDYKLKFTCKIKLITPVAAARCLNEVFYFNREGSEILTDSEYFCGMGNVERKSFLNQAVISYVSAPYYQRIVTNSVKETHANIQNNTTMLEETKNKQKQITTTVKPIATTATSKAVKVNQMTTTTTAQTIGIPYNLLTTSFTQPSLSSTASYSTATDGEENVSANTEDEDKNVSNSFAYVVALLSSKIDIQAFAINTTTATTTKSPTTTAASDPTGTTTSSSTASSRLTSALNDFLPVNTWRNGSIATHKISTKRVAKIVNPDYTSSQPTFSSPRPTPPPASIRTTQGGGSFSCLVEVLETQCECGWSSTVKIAGASGVAGTNEFPSMAGVMTIKNQKIFCGATIIHHRYLLSAAHCYITPETNRPEYLTAVVGEHDFSTVLESFYTRQYDILKIIPHEQYHATSVKAHNDIALLKTRYPIEWNRSVGPICLPFYSFEDSGGAIPVAGQNLVTAGWGTTSFGGEQSSVLLKTTLDVISRKKCKRIVRNLPSGAFCTYTPGRDTCQYDSGGALYLRRERLYAVGIVSYGFACATNQPSVNTRISAYMKWITNNTPEAKYCTN